MSLDCLLAACEQKGGLLAERWFYSCCAAWMCREAGVQHRVQKWEMPLVQSLLRVWYNAGMKGQSGRFHCVQLVFPCNLQH